MLSLISLNDPSDRAVLLRCASTLSYIHGLSGSYDTEAGKYYKFKIKQTSTDIPAQDHLLIQVHPKKLYSS